MLSKELQDYIKREAISAGFPKVRRSPVIVVPIPSDSEIREELFDWFHGKLESRKYNFAGIFGIFPCDYDFVNRVITFMADYSLEAEWQFEKLMIFFKQESDGIRVCKPTIKNAVRKFFGRKIPDEDTTLLSIPSIPSLLFSTKSKVNHAISTNGLCDSCGQLRPCMCGDFCPRCCSDVTEENNVVKCTKCDFTVEV